MFGQAHIVLHGSRIHFIAPTHCMSKLLSWSPLRSIILVSPVLFFSSFSISHCGSWTCWSGLSPAWFCTSYTLCCALSAGTTLCLSALFSAATTMSFLNCSETALCWAKPTPTLCPPAAWGSSHIKGFSQSGLTFKLWTWRGYSWRSGRDCWVDLVRTLWG